MIRPKHPESLHETFRQHAERRADRTFCTFVDEAITLTYGELEAKVASVATGLRLTGLVAGDRVVVFMQNSVDYLIAMLATQRARAIYVPCSTALAEDEVRFVLTDSDAAVVIVDATTEPMARAALATIPIPPRIITRHRGSLSDLSLEDLAVLPDDIEPVRADDLALIMYTSGTTARPKGVVFRHGNLVSAAHGVAQGCRWSNDDRLLHYFPLHHANGGLIQLGPTMLLGSELVMLPRFSASRFGTQLHDLDITMAAVNATHVRMILGQPERPEDAAHRCWRMFFGMSLDEATMREFEMRFHTRLISSYGLTETMGPCVLGPVEGDRDLTASGYALPSYTIHIVDGADQELPAGSIGEILIESDDEFGMCGGYWRNEEATRELFRGGLMHTGDIGFIDTEGRVHFIERAKDMIKRSGFNVSPAEVERVIALVADASDVAVVGAPDPIRDEQIVAFVVAKRPIDEGAVLELCSRHLAAYKVPQRVLTVSNLPRDVLGKVDKKALRREATRVTEGLNGGDPASSTPGKAKE